MRLPTAYRVLPITMLMAVSCHENISKYQKQNVGYSLYGNDIKNSPASQSRINIRVKYPMINAASWISFLKSLSSLFGFYWEKTSNMIYFYMYCVKTSITHLFNC